MKPFCSKPFYVEPFCREPLNRGAFFLGSLFLAAPPLEVFTASLTWLGSVEMSVKVSFSSDKLLKGKINYQRIYYIHWSTRLRQKTDPGKPSRFNLGRKTNKSIYYSFRLGFNFETWSRT
jgi:hypothetical protein